MLRAVLTLRMWGWGTTRLLCVLFLDHILLLVYRVGGGGGGGEVVSVYIYDCIRIMNTLSWTTCKLVNIEKDEDHIDRLIVLISGLAYKLN